MSTSQKPTKCAINKTLRPHIYIKPMKLITVIPLTNTRNLDELSYFTASDIDIGAIVSVPVRARDITAIVIGAKPVEDAKSAIRSADFVIRKLGKVKTNSFFPVTFILAAKGLADHYATSVGNIIRTLTSKNVLDNIQKIKFPNLAVSGARYDNQNQNKEVRMDETYAVQGDDNDRMSAWRSLIRQEFAQKRSVAIYAPTLEDIRNIHASLAKGIEEYIFILNGNLTSKKILETWEAIAKAEHPIVIVATGSFAYLPRIDIDTVIIERENGRGWITRNNPYMDMRLAIEKISRKMGLKVYLADCLLRLETLHRVENHEIAEGSPFKWRSISTAKDELIDMRTPIHDGTLTPASKPHINKKNFRVLSERLEEIIRQSREDNSHIFIMTARRGLSSLTVCDDCETIVSCKDCTAPVVLHASKETGRNFFMCHNCGSRRNAEELCMNCGGWRLTPLGIGTERVVEEIRSKFKEAEIVSIDSDNTKTEKQIQIALKKFRDKPGSILVGTEMAMMHISLPVEHVAIASIDSLLALPDFRIQERMMYALTRLRNLAERTFIVQTRRIEEGVFSYGMKGNLGDFYRNMIKERKQFSYPPFSLLLKISMEGKKEEIAKEMANIRTLIAPDIAPNELDIFPAFTSAANGKSAIHGLVKIPATRWPKKELVEKLRILPPHISVKIDPESLL